MGLELAHFPEVKARAGFDLEAQPSFDPKQIRGLAASRWIANGEEVPLLVPCGRQDAFVGCALGREALLPDYTIQFTTATAQVEGLAKAHSDGASTRSYLRV